MDQPAAELTGGPEAGAHYYWTMSLRTKLLTFFLMLATVPMVAIGLFQYRQSKRAVEDLLSAQVGELAGQAAEEIADRWNQRKSELLLLSENTETQAAFKVSGTGAGESSTGLDEREADARARAFLEEAWRSFGHRYERIELRVPDSRVRFVLESREVSDAASPSPVRMDLPIFDVESGGRIGTITGQVRYDALFPREALEARFGRTGSTAVVDLGSGRILWAPRRSVLRQPLEVLVGPEGARRLGDATSPRGRIGYEVADTARFGVYISLQDPPWMVLASTAVEEFAGPFSRIRTGTLLFVLAGTVLITIGFTLLLRRSTDSLLRLARAADQIGGGRFDPPLPPRDNDEVGRLSGALGIMATRIRGMVSQIERSRQLAAVGQFAAQLAHEIRNPLTSLRLNQQGLERDLEASGAPDSVRAQVEISLNEITRLERVARGVLDLARPPFEDLRPCSTHQAVQDAVSLVGPQMAGAGVLAEVRFEATADSVLAAPGELEGVFLNLFLNAVEAMTGGGILQVNSYNPTDDKEEPPGSGTVRLVVSDTGPGVAAEVRERVFDPFVSTKGAGSGLGLSVALQRIEALGGALVLRENPHECGASFQIDLPLAPVEAAGESGVRSP